MVRIVHTTNTYLDRRNMGRRQRQDDYLSAFRQSIEYALDAGADAVVHTGNLFFTQSPDQRVVDACRDILDGARRADVPVYLLYGECDCKVTDLLADFESDGLLTRLTPRWNTVGDVAVFAHDATEDDPESGFHRPPEDVTARLAVLFDDFRTVTEHADVAAYQSAVGWKIDGVLLGDQSEPVRETADGVDILSPGPPERVVGKWVVDAEDLGTPQVFQYDVTEDGIEVSTRAVDARPVAGFRLDLEPTVTTDELRDRIAEMGLEGHAVLAEVTGEDGEGALSKQAIQNTVAERAAFVRLYDERVPGSPDVRDSTADSDGSDSDSTADSDGSDSDSPAEPTTPAGGHGESDSGAREGGQAETDARDTSRAAADEGAAKPDTAADTATGTAGETDRLVVFGHVAGDGAILDRIAAETADMDVDGYVYTGTNRAVPGSDDADGDVATGLSALADQAPVYVVPDERVSVWDADTDDYAPPAPPGNATASTPEGVTTIPLDGREAVDAVELTRNPWLDGEATVLVSHHARPDQWHGGHAAYLAGGHFVGRRDRTYLNVGFGSFDPGVGRDVLYGQYFDVVVGPDGTFDVTWEPLGVLDAMVCPDHEAYGHLYLLEGLECPFCAMERRETGADTAVETPTTVYERAYLVASDDVPARRAHQVAYFDRPDVTRPDRMTSERFPPANSDAQADLDDEALAAGDLRGELMYFVGPDAVDDVWLSVRDLVATGAIFDARVTTAFTQTARGDTQYLLLVAVPNYGDVEDARRVHRKLTSELPLEDPAPVKPTYYTNRGIYASNADSWGLSRSTRYSVRADATPTGRRGLPEAPTVDADVFPADVTEYDQWVLWKPEPDGRKVPRAPWVTNDDTFVSAMDEANQTTFERARQYCEKMPGPDYGLAFTITEDDPFVLLDFDDARDPETRAVDATVRQYVEDASSYADVSTSGTGVHVLARGELSDSVAAIIADSPDQAFSLEVYDSDRYAVMTGAHLAATPTETTGAQGLLDQLESEHATRRERDHSTTGRPARPRAELADIDETTDIEDVYDSIETVRPGDIRLRSRVTEERADGTKSLDPSWTESESGTRLGQLDDLWVYRKGMYALDALQVVALEEGLITRPDEYPSGETFWQAVAALRERGAHVPRYTPVES